MCTKYEVLGGLHTFIAKSQLAQEIPYNDHYKCATTEIYVGLTDEAALRLAQQHKQNSHLPHVVIQVSIIMIMNNYLGM